MTNTNFSIPEIHCMSCEALIRVSLKEMPGINSVATNLSAKTATIDFDDNIVHKQQIQQQIQKET
ncbi:MAG: heavy metal-associated domain-containing protein [bacterium]